MIYSRSAVVCAAILVEVSLAACRTSLSRRLVAAFGEGLPAAAAATLGQLLLCLWECSGLRCAEVSAFVLLWGVYLCGSCLLSWVRLHLRCYQQMQEQPSPEPGCIGTSRPPFRGRQGSDISPTPTGTSQAQA